jgi:hypothetical protein
MFLATPSPVATEGDPTKHPSRAGSRTLHPSRASPDHVRINVPDWHSSAPQQSRPPQDSMICPARGSPPSKHPSPATSTQRTHASLPSPCPSPSMHPSRPSMQASPAAPTQRPCHCPAPAQALSPRGTYHSKSSIGHAPTHPHIHHAYLPAFRAMHGHNCRPEPTMHGPVRTCAHPVTCFPRTAGLLTPREDVAAGCRSNYRSDFWPPSAWCRWLLAVPSPHQHLRQQCKRVSSSHGPLVLGRMTRITCARSWQQRTSTERSRLYNRRAPVQQRVRTLM